MKKILQPIVHPDAQQRGVVAIFMAVILSLLLLVSTMSSARLQVSEIGQSSQVDRSEQAYYAAEAGIEEALLRLKNNPTGTLSDVFPEQTGACASGTVRGAQSALLNDSGNWVQAPAITPDCGVSEIGQLAWRNRQVYQSSSLLAGTQVKDESIQYDTSSLRRNTATGTVGADGKDTDGTDIFAHFQGLQYCWSVNAGAPTIELTTLSWQKTDLTNIATEKLLVPSNNATYLGGTYGAVQTGAYNSQYSYCLRYTVNDSNRRYIFRLKPIFAPTPAGNPGTTPQDDYSVSYQASLLDSTLSPYPLYIPNDAIVIDVTGQSGDIRRRLVAKKKINGQILSVFDYVLYSGDPVTPICKAGVLQSDVSYSGCLVVPADNQAPDAPPVSSPPPPTLSCSTQSSTAIQLTYSYTDISPTLWRGGTQINVSSGSSDTGLSPSTAYTYYLRNGSSGSSPVVAQTTCTTSPPPATISCSTQSSSAIQLTYNYGGVSGTLWRDGSQNYTASGSNDTGLAGSTTYTYYLRWGSSGGSPVLAQTSCTTSTPYPDQYSDVGYSDVYYPDQYSDVGHGCVDLGWFGWWCW